MNPINSSGVGFCIYEVRVNGNVTTDEINSSAFEIDFSNFDFKIGDPIQVIIKCKDDCTPRVLNPEVLKPKSTFNTVSIKVGKDNILRWSTNNESGSLSYIVEQYRWNKWVKVGTVEGKGSRGDNQYQIEVHPCSGDNIFRVKQVDYSKQPRYSKEAKYKSLDPQVTYSPTKKIANEIKFSAETMYEIYDPYGVLLLKGFGIKVDISTLKKLDKFMYTMLFDNQIIQFNKE